MRRFIAANRERLRGDDYAALYDWSIESPAEFWAAVWRSAACKPSRHTRPSLRDGIADARRAVVRGARLNFAANLLEHDASGTAIVFGNERGDRMALSWNELRAQVAQRRGSACARSA